jgi:hypothetical protein
MDRPTLNTIHPTCHANQPSFPPTTTHNPSTLCTIRSPPQHAHHLLHPQPLT